MVKDEDGKIQDYKEENDDPEVKDADKPETGTKKEEKKKVMAEDTLDMLQKQLGGKKPAVKKKVGVKKKKVEIDRKERFFNNYSENPHLQQIENGYLKYLEVQHAKESHLKDIKKFQIMYALKTI